MKIYVYSPEQARLAMTPHVFDLTVAGHQRHGEGSGIGFLVDIEKTIDPGKADWFFLPYDLGHWEAKGGSVRAIRNGVKNLPFWNGNEKRHFFFLHSDHPDPVGIDSVIFRQSVNRFNKDANTISFPPRVDDFSHLVNVDFNDLRYFACFVGHITAHQCRIDMYRSLKMSNMVLFDVVQRHWGAYQNTSLGSDRRTRFIEALKESCLGLAPRGGGEHSFRFFEVMSAGRVPVLISDTYERPFENLIDYNSCSFRFRERDAISMHDLFRVMRLSFTVSELQEMGRKARQYWEEYLAPAQWNKMVVRCLEERL